MTDPAAGDPRVILERIEEGFFALDGDWQFTYLNERAVELLDRPADDLVGTVVWEAFPDALGTAFEAEYREAMATQEATNFEAHYPPLSTWFEVDAYPSESGLSVYFRDVTERKETRERLERERDRLEEFAAVVSHDLRTPLNVATGHLEDARAECDSDHLERVAEAHERIDEMIEGVLALARHGRIVEETEPVDVASLARQVWVDLDTPDATLAVEGAPSVDADPERLRALLENLVRNAVEHGSAGGRPATDDAVEHAAGGQSGGASELRIAVGAGDGEGFYVADDGPGVPESERDRVFDRDYTTGGAGTGLGLAIVQEVATAHGWTVAVAESRWGGARFEVHT